ncbi:MAG: anti-sigma factor [Chloroflexota bacterium]
MTEHIEDLFPFYAMDALTDEEKQQVDIYIKENPEAEPRLRAFFDSAELLPFENESMAPSPEVKAALIHRVREDKKPKHAPQAQKSNKRSWWDGLFAPKAPAIFAPAVPVLIGLLIFAFFRNSGMIRQLNDTISEQQSAIVDLQTELDNQRTTIDTQLADLETQQIQLDDQQVALSIYTAVNAQIVTIESTGLQPDATGRLTYDPDTRRAILDVIALANDPETVYQLWFIQGETPISAGVFDVDESGSEMFVVDTAVPLTFDAIGISIEPPGGSEQPGDIVLLGTGS